MADGVVPDPPPSPIRRPGGPPLGSRFLRYLSPHLAHPRGPAGRYVARLLNKNNRGLNVAAVDRLGVASGAVVADIGFGGGVGLELLLERVGPPGRVHGVEISRTMVAAAQRRFAKEVAEGRLILHSAGVSQLPFAPRSLDAILTVNTLYFWPDPKAGMAELHRVLVPGGQVALATVTKSTMQTLPFVNQRFTLYEDAEIVALVEGAGFVADQSSVGDSPGRLTLGLKPA